LKRWKIPNGKSEAVHQGRADNTMTQRKKTKGQTMIYKTLHKKLKTEKHELNQNPEE
jgi:hypothetical protein